VPAKKKHHLTAAKVQTDFNDAIRRRDGACVTCGKSSELQASHFFEVGGSGALRFYPPNVNAQCGGCHLDYHNRTGLPYTRWMQKNVSELEWMEFARKATVHYSRIDLEEIRAMCKNDELEKLEAFIRGKIETASN
jgi:hypothetical protein